MKTIAYRLVDGCAVVAFGKNPPTATDWSLYTTFIRSECGTLPRQRGLVILHGASIGGDQRRELDQLVNERTKDRKVAVVTSLTFIRGFVRALAVSDPAYKTFEPSELEQALRYLDIRERFWQEMQRALEDVSHEVGC